MSTAIYKLLNVKVKTSCLLVIHEYHKSVVLCLILNKKKKITFTRTKLKYFYNNNKSVRFEKIWKKEKKDRKTSALSVPQTFWILRSRDVASETSTLSALRKTNDRNFVSAWRRMEFRGCILLPFLSKKMSSGVPPKVRVASNSGLMTPGSFKTESL